MPRCSSTLLAVGLWLAVLSASLPAHAEEGQGLIKMGESDMSDDRARAHFKVGTSLYESGRFKEAAAEWESAYALSKRDALLYNIYVAYRDASDLPKAIDALTRYLATDLVDPKQRLNLEARRNAMQGSVDAANQAKAAEPAVPPTAAEPSTPPPAAEPAAEPVPDEEQSGSIVPLVLVIGGGALITGGLITGLVANGKVSSIEDACPKDRCPASFDLDGERRSARTLAAVTDLLLVGGAVVTTFGIVLWLMDDDTESPRAAASASAQLAPSLMCAPTGCAASLSGSF